jgi:rod shape-determining protein MreC
MDLLSRYRNVTVLLLVIFAQLVLLAYQVKSNQDVRLIRIWAVTAVTPVAKVVETVRSGTVGFVGNYVFLHDLKAENERLKADLGKIKVENEFLKSELETAGRLKALAAFQEQNPSKTLPARVIGITTGTNSKVVFVDQGSSAGVMKGMGVITPDGIIGKIVAAYPTASQVLMITDPNFAAGVISQKHRVRGTVMGLGQSKCRVEYIQNEEQVDKGEKFYTSGDDGIFPKGLPVGTVAGAPQPGNPYKEVYLTPSGLQGGLEEVLVVLQGVHMPVPDPATASNQIYLQPPPPDEPTAAPGGATTPADRLWDRYKKIGEVEKHTYGEGLPGSKPPDFNVNLDEAAKAAAAAAARPGAAAAGTSAPAQQAKPPGVQQIKPPAAPPAGGVPAQQAKQTAASGAGSAAQRVKPGAAQQAKPPGVQQIKPPGAPAERPKPESKTGTGADGREARDPSDGAGAGASS